MKFDPKDVKKIIHMRKVYWITIAGAIIVLLNFMFFVNTQYFQGILVFGIIILSMPVLLDNYFRYRKLKEMELYLSDFLREVSESTRAGMTLSKALASASKGAYGALTTEMNIVASQISWGVSFEEALYRFMKRNDSKLIKQAVLIIIESHKSGGDIGTILETVSMDIKKLKDLERERQSKLRVYVISTYFIFFLFLGIILMLTKTFIPATPKLNSVASIIGGTPSHMSEDDFRTFFFNLCLIEGFFAGLISGQMGEGSLIAGVKHSVILLIITIASFQLILTPQPFAERIAGEILLIPPEASGSSSTDTAYTIFSDVTSAEIMDQITKQAAAKNLQGWHVVTADDIQFTARDCRPCDEGKIIVDAGSITVKTPTKIVYNIYNRQGTYDIVVEGG